MFLSLALLLPLPVSANTYTVTNTNDWFWGSLRQAIEDANNHPGHDTIVFAIGSGPKTIKLDTVLPLIIDPVTIDGWTQPGWTGNPIIEIDGTKVTADSGLRVCAPSTIRGLVINRFGHHGIGIGPDFVGHDADGTVVQGCWIGVGLDGVSTRPNQRDGIAIFSNDVVIGGDGPNQRNVISYNGWNGVSIGRHIWSGQKGNTHGHRTLVRGNFIGVDSSGLVSRGNARAGVEIFSGSDSVIGGDTPALGNVIAGNGSEGVKINAFGALGETQFVLRNTVENNKIGVNVNGAAVGNGFVSGVLSPGVRTHTPESRIVQNVIANNAGAGVVVRYHPGNLISNNSIYANGGIGIDLGFWNTDPSVVTPNDFNDADTGGNMILNFPLLTSALDEPSRTKVTGTYQGEANKTLTLELYQSPACDASGHGEGQQFITTATVSTNASGSGTFSVLLQPKLPVGSVVTAIARDGAGNTSEFSPCRAVALTPPPVIDGYLPGGGRVGTYVTVTGQNLTWINSVRFVPGIPANIQILNDNTLVTQVPEGAKSGNITITSPYGSASTANFKVTPPKQDMNGDEKPDLIWRHYTQGLNSIWVHGVGDVQLPAVPDVNWEMQGTGDFNNDGSHDIVWRNGSTGVNSIWYMNGTSYSTSVLLPTVADPNWHMNAVGDFDGDGDSDLVWRNYATGDGSIWLMDGPVWNGAYEMLPNITTQWKIEAAGDFNLDGHTDLLWRNSTTGQVSIWHMDGASWEGEYTMLPSVADPNWMIEGAADWDLDGDVDIIWRNPATGQNSVWLLIGAYWDGVTYVLLGPVTDSNWRIEDY